MTAGHNESLGSFFVPLHESKDWTRSMISVRFKTNTWAVKHYWRAELSALFHLIKFSNNIEEIIVNISRGITNMKTVPIFIKRLESEE